MQSSAYSALERWLHWLALAPVSVRHLAFDLERQFALPYRPRNEHDPANGAVYVCGLARSGTTILLRVLDQVDIFRSLTYRDMPFVMAPNIWRLMTRHAKPQSAPMERAHSDGILIDFDSPEAFEEVFWRTFGEQTLTSDSLGEKAPSPDVLDAFADYRAMVANPKTDRMPATGNPRRYLSKNNNNLLRLPSLCADVTATVLLVYRDPVATARSLHRQHVRFCTAQQQDRFTRRYMGWLGHHEFGLDHRPFGFAKPAMDASLSPDDPNYWLDYWTVVYNCVLAQRDLRLHMVDHAALCAQPLLMLEALFVVLGVQVNAARLADQISESTTVTAHTDEFRPEILQRAKATYSAMLASSKNLFILT